jgi:hypothetical protein
MPVKATNSRAKSNSGGFSGNGDAIDVSLAASGKPFDLAQFRANGKSKISVLLRNSVKCPSPPSQGPLGGCLCRGSKGAMW